MLTTHGYMEGFKQFLAINIPQVGDIQHLLDLWLILGQGTCKGCSKPYEESCLSCGTNNSWCWHQSLIK